MSNSNNPKGILALSICAFIWGTSFVAQSMGSSYAEPFTFNCSRSIVASIFLFLLCPLVDKVLHRPYYILGSPEPKLQHKLLKGGFLCGAILTVAVYMQQWGITYTTAGKSGFITALYIVMVPLLSSLFLGKKIGIQHWLSVAVAVLGMYLICITEALTINKGDLITLACPITFALQILVIDHFIGELDGVRMSMVQFSTCALLNGLLMFLFEKPSLEQVLPCLGPIFYLGIMSSGIAYTLQIIGQKYTSPVLACMLMSLESVFALFSGWVVLGQQMSFREITGCIIVFIAIMLAQLPLPLFSSETSNKQ